MKKPFARYKVLGNSRGGALVLVAFMLVVLLGVAALAIDIGFLSTTKNELQDVADAAALAGAGYLGAIYKDLPPAQHGTHTFPKADIADVVQAVAQKNKAAGSSISVDTNTSDFVVGLWDPAAKVVGPTLTGPDAVYVKVRRDNTANSPISTFFAGIFGINTMTVTAEAVAALSGPLIVDEGELMTPIGISEAVFAHKTCKDSIFFSPTTKSCAAWTNLSTDGISSSSLSDRIFDLVVSDDCQFCGTETDFTISGGDALTLNGDTWLHENFTPKNTVQKNLDTDVIVPQTSIDQQFMFIGGETSQFGGEYLGTDYDGNTGTPFKVQGASGAEQMLTLATANDPSPMYNMFDYFKYRDNDSGITLDSDLLDPDGNNFVDKDGNKIFLEGDYFDKNEIWSTMVPVYKDEPNVNCDGIGTNATGLKKIVGFARVIVFQPNRAPAKNLIVKVDCKITYVEGRSGGGTVGNTKGTIPNLVM